MRLKLSVFTIGLFIAFIECDVAKNVGLLDDTSFVKLGEFPYFAMIYFMDDSVKSMGFHFLRAGILIRKDMIITASVDKGGDEDLGFPRKTLLARLGRINTAFWGRVNKGIGEQEREVIKIFRPATYNKFEWWLSDISLMNTVTPFDLSNSVNIAPIPRDHLIIREDTICMVVVFQEVQSNIAMKKVSVRILNDKIGCGNNDYDPEKMLCSIGFNELTGAGELDGNCLANSGGPLICNNTVVATQTYRKPSCQPPYLYQRLDYWRNLIDCSLRNDCQSKDCETVCTVSDKDSDEEEIGSREEEEIKENVEEVAAPKKTEKPKKTKNKATNSKKLSSTSSSSGSTISQLSACLSMILLVTLT